jgi:hypothetical protein
MDSPIAARASRVRVLAAQRPSQLLFAAFLLLLIAAAWFAVSRDVPTASGFAPAARLAAAPSLDDARQVWSIPAPAPEVRVAPAPTAGSMRPTGPRSLGSAPWRLSPRSRPAKRVPPARGRSRTQRSMPRQRQERRAGWPAFPARLRRASS